MTHIAPCYTLCKIAECSCFSKSKKKRLDFTKVAATADPPLPDFPTSDTEKADKDGKDEERPADGETELNKDKEKELPADAVSQDLSAICSGGFNGDGEL